LIVTVVPAGSSGSAVRAGKDYTSLELLPMITETLDTADAVQLVLGVARLGENDLRGWWQGHAMDRTGRYVLSGMFRRTWRSAALELDLAAATRMHNELLGRPTALHLFSDLLPFRRWAVSWLAEQKTSEKIDPLLSRLEAWTAETATESVRAWSGQSQVPPGEHLGEGPAGRQDDCHGACR
jgi:hypothetical protein